MRVALISDLHVEHQLDVVGALAAELSKLSPDVTLLLGDVCSDLDLLGRSLRMLVRAASGPVLFLPGNHEIWARSVGGASSRARWEHALPRRVRRAGAVLLGRAPVEVGDLVVVGAIGWFDGSLAGRPLTPADLARARDQQEVRWEGEQGEPLTAEALSHFFVASLAAQCQQVRGLGRRLMAVTHMVPAAAVAEAIVGAGHERAERLPTLGSGRLWEVLREQEGLVAAACGHVHTRWHGMLEAAAGQVPFYVSAVGYPRQRRGTIREHVAGRLTRIDLAL